MIGRILTGFCGVGLLYIGARSLEGGAGIVLWSIVLVLWALGVVLLAFAVRDQEGRGDKAW